MEQKIKQHKPDFVISVAASNIDITLINMEEMQLYCTTRNRVASVVTEKKSYGELDKMNFQLVMNYTKPKARVVNSKDKPYLDVFDYVIGKYKSGLLIVENDTLSGAISDLLCNSQMIEKNDIDVMICRDGLGAITDAEIRKANLLRISADPNLDPVAFQKLQNTFQEKILTLMICQFFVNEQYENVNKYFAEMTDKYRKEGREDFIDYYELNKQLAYFIYFDIEKNKILNPNRATIKKFAEKLKSQGLLPIPDGMFEEFINSITVE
jgi:hypothetical protein